MSPLAFQTKETVVVLTRPSTSPRASKPAIGKEKSLYCEQRGNSQEGRIRAKQGGQDHAPAKMIGGTCGPNSKADHLSGKDKSAKHPHQGDFPVTQVLLTFLEQKAIVTAVTAYSVQPTAGETSASAICMRCLL